MSTALAVAPQPGEFSPEQIDLLKRTICKGSTDDEFTLFIGQCKRTGLDPFARQIHAVKRWDGKQKREVMQVQVGIDGYRLIAERTGLYAGNDDPVFDDEDKPRKATVTVYKLVGGVRCPFTASARWEQYYPGEKQGFMWNKMPHLMLGKCAEALALRKAFPAELSGLYTTDEMQQQGGQIVQAEVKQIEAADEPKAADDDDGQAFEAQLDQWQAKLALADTLDALVAVWQDMPRAAQKELEEVKDQEKARILGTMPEVLEWRNRVVESLTLVGKDYNWAMHLWGNWVCGWNKDVKPRVPPLETLTAGQLQHLAAKIQDSYGRQDPYGRSEGK
jgi:phage recombination protein Bet